MIELWLKHYGPQWLFPLAAIVLVPFVAKGIFGFQRSRSQDRKDFLDLWPKRDQTDDLWLQVAVRHAYGTYLPAAVLRYLISQPQGARALLEVSEIWPLIDWNDESGQLYWRDPRYFSPAARRWDYRFSLIGYFISAAVLMIGLWLVLAGYAKGGWVEWTYLWAGSVATFYLLAKQERLKTAEDSLPRWLGKMVWEGGNYNHAKNVGRMVPRKPRRSKRSAD
ncbi:hypothetical protein [Lysobacter capsici]|uniref:hypothetical protein n=1 Tax=Lysobacter capsici TaxID=435897 RepID=UPI001C005D45|nr:hypothetical protein [Lysobacter capsici]QWF15110.1 hypothetical protein KME82_15010 [Lysobacter capsici]